MSDFSPVERQMRFWIVALAALLVGVYLLRGILLPFVAGLALAYILDPVATRLERIGMGRLTASLLILLLFVLAFILTLVLLLPVVVNQLGVLLENLPANARNLQQWATEYGGPLIEHLGGPEALATVERSLTDIVGQAARWLGTFATSLWSGGQAVISVLALLVVTPVVAFYLLVDWGRMVETIDSWLPRRHADTIRTLAQDMNGAIAGFIRGQALVCFILGSFYAIALTSVGLNFGLLIGLVSGALTFIPYVGSFTGFVLSVGVALVQFWPDWTMIAVTVGIFLFGQFVEGNILSPKLVGDAVGLHPVWLMFALVAFGSLFGFVGLLLAVPIAAAIGVLTRFALQLYLASPLYTGADREPRARIHVDV
ncbi:putative PurR-regulated permease PerM [Pseudochelatococcus lubricantis]|uniref:PurR-regulated permease PerM n=1 Tax=Pseudochelatococcus lubricantis TaxID=1538102 RepID=A0ABX0UVB2_9HYPH|nr:AI-2E family transporter [Pseudochelatococcus lubricantis]NIJ56323.1 putative PurR-regulated permease PerM [Pseudochelatococcus lubricantis]